MGLKESFCYACQTLLNYQDRLREAGLLFLAVFLKMGGYEHGH